MTRFSLFSDLPRTEKFLAKRIQIVMMVFVFVSGCASLSKEECQVADWEMIGYEDGSRGHATTRMASHRKACAEHGVRPDMAAYQAGHAKGVRNFCQPAGGYQLGKSGRRYNGVCPSDLEKPFLAAYKQGQAEHKISSDIRKKQRDVKSKEKELETITGQLAQKEAQIINGGGTPGDRALLMTETKKLNQRQGELESQLKDLQVELAVLEEKLKNQKNTASF